MYVIVEIQGQQFKVETGKKLFVHYLGAENGAVLEFDKVLLVDVLNENPIYMQFISRYYSSDLNEIS